MLVKDARLQDGSPLVEPGVIDALRRHAIDDHPNEAIGFVDAAGSYHRLENKADDPEKFGIIDKHVLALEMENENLRALCHSHPGGPDCPSESDGRAQIEMDVPFIIISTNGQACAQPFAFGDQLLDEAPIIGRPFRHYVDDCYSLIRRWWRREHGEILPEYPRNWEWWHPECPGEKNLYQSHFADAGFRIIDPREVREGDCFLAAVPFRDGSGGMFRGVLNHAGVVVERGLVLHHPSSGLAYDPMRLSKRDPIARWLPWVKEGGNHWLRRD